MATNQRSAAEQRQRDDHEELRHKGLLSSKPTLPRIDAAISGAEGGSALSAAQRYLKRYRSLPKRDSRPAP
jgi:hypothetical protein